MKPAWNDVRESIFQDRYSQGEGYPQDMWRRLAKSISMGDDEYEKYLKELKDFKFVPAGRMLAGIGTSMKSTYYNCYYIPFHNNSYPEKGRDSRQGIMDTLSTCVEIMARGGGVGLNWSILRPKGSIVEKVHGKSSGVVSWMRAFNGVFEQVEQGGSRRAATMSILEEWHPQIMDFINAKKEEDNNLEMMNISVGISDSFMEAVENDEEYELVFPDTTYPRYDDEWDGDIQGWKRRGYPVDTYDVVSAREVWKAICASAHVSAEPGIIWLERADRMANTGNVERIAGSNPCVTGDTLIAVADGRGEVPIKQLEDEGENIPVYCSDSEGRIHIRTGRSPRKTGENVDVYRVYIDDGSYIDATPDHKFILTDGEELELRDLSEGDSLLRFDKYQFSYGGKSNKYWGIQNAKGGVYQEHRLISEYFLGRRLKRDGSDTVHHLNFDGLDNRPENMEVVTPKEHVEFHDISGDKNPTRRFPEKSIFNDPEFQKSIREKYHIGATRSKETCDKIGERTKERFEDSDFREKHREAVITSMNRNKESYEKGFIKRAEKYLRKMKKLTDLECFIDGRTVKVKKICENCGKKFSVVFRRRGQMYCSPSCGIEGSTEKRSKNYSKNASKRREVKKKRVFNIFYSEIQNKGRVPTRDEFLKLLNRNGINDLRTCGWSYSYSKFLEKVCDVFSVDSVSSRAITYNTGNCRETVAESLIESGLTYNHKVVSIEYKGKKDVYNLTVDEFHNYAVITDNQDDKKSGIVICNCSEQLLGNWGVCNLGAANLVSFVGKNRVEWTCLERAVRQAVRFLDTVIDRNAYVLPQIRKNQMKLTRIGLGTMGLADALIIQGIPYGSDESLDFIDEVYSFIRDKAYDESIELAKERGVAPAFYKDEFLERPFIKTLPAKLRRKIGRSGIRNLSILTSAPTGTTAMLAGVSAGIEPNFSLEFKRSDGTGEAIHKHWLLQEDIEDTGQFVCAKDIPVEKHVEVQARVQKYIDSSISKTINAPSDHSLENLEEALVYAYKQGCKGVTYFREGTLEGVLTDLTDNKCPECSADLDMSEGCNICPECGWGKCSM